VIGESIDIGTHTLTMPSLSVLKNAEAEANPVKTLVTLPQSVALARNSYRKPLTGNSDTNAPPLTSVKRNEKDQILDWSILGSVDDFTKIDRIKNPDAYTEKTRKVSVGPTTAVTPIALSPWMELQKAKKAEKAKNKRRLRNMLFEDRLIETHDQRSAKLWEKRAQEWKDIQARLSKKLGVHPSDLSFSSGDAYNTKVQEHQLLNKAALIHEKFGKFHWLMSLRGFNSNYVRVGHEFAGLFCRVREPILPSHELIVKPKNTTEDLYLGQDRTTSRSLSRSGWQQDQMFAKKT